MHILYKNEIFTPIGTATLLIFDDRLVRLSIGEKYNAMDYVAAYLPDYNISTDISPLTAQIKSQMTEYFCGRLKKFTTPTAFLSGTMNQKRLWSALADIPYGHTISYAQLGAMVGCTSARAVGTMVGHNPLPVILPCHRIVRTDGKIGQFSCGEGEATKRFLLELERENA